MEPPRTTECPQCHGTGVRNGETCDLCGGTGEIGVEDKEEPE
jgi:DnaJ-class molecular chaperone